MSKKPILYMHPFSPPARSVLLLGAELGISFDEIEVDLHNLEHKKADFIKLNPQHTVPLLDDNGVLIADSHAICAYLSEKFGKTDRLYPKDLVKRAQVDARLHFDSGHLFARLRFLYEPILVHKKTELQTDRIESLQTAWDILERFLEESAFVCGDEVTIADICLIATTSSACDIVPLDPVKHSNIIRWVDRMSKLPFYEEINGARAKALQDFIRGSLTKHSQ